MAPSPLAIGTPPAPELASRGGFKLWHALHAFGTRCDGLVCADFGCSTGGFTDVMLHLGAVRVHAVDTAYGELAWKLRTDERVVVHERTNALHAPLPETGEVDLIAVDLSWTRQRHAIPAALRWLKPDGRVVTLLKPHYEVDKDQLGPGGVLPRADALDAVKRTLQEMDTLGVRTLAICESPVLGGAVSGKKKRKRKGAGNAEWLALCVRV